MMPEKFWARGPRDNTNAMTSDEPGFLPTLPASLTLMHLAGKPTVDVDTFSLAITANRPAQFIVSDS
jgi:hypothetical protein